MERRERERDADRDGEGSRGEGENQSVFVCFTAQSSNYGIARAHNHFSTCTTFNADTHNDPLL